MMASNLLSRLLPINPSAPSIYEEMRAHDDAAESDIEDRAGMSLDEENFGYRDDELGTADVLGEESRITTESTAFLSRPTQRTDRTNRQHNTNNNKSRAKWSPQSPRLLEEDGDDDVPASLLIEGHDNAGARGQTQPRLEQAHSQKSRAAIPGPSNRKNRAHWEATQAQQRLHDDMGGFRASNPPRPRPSLLTGSPRDKAMWQWSNVINLDNFLGDVYDYFRESGIWCILLSRALDICSKVFVAVFTTFLTQCVNFKAIPQSKALSDVLVPQCTKKISGLPNLAIWLFSFYIIWRVYMYFIDIPRLLRLHNFYLYLLEVPDSDMQTISWQDIVGRLMGLRDSNPITVEKISPMSRKFIRGSQSKERLDAHDIANRLMRRENYLIAFFNKDILDLTLPIPFLQDRQLFSHALMWSINWCILDFLFKENGQVSQLVLKDSHRRELSKALKQRFIFAGVMNAVLAPVIVVYFSVVYFFRYFREYQNNPSALGSRQYTPLAEWKFREFNELPHIFEKRINMSHPFASRYLDQFPKAKTASLAGFVALVAGAVVSVLVLATLWDPEMFLSFELTPDKTVLFYITVFGAIWAIANGTIPDDNLVFDPEYALQTVIDYTRYNPKHWEGQLHSDGVRREFSTLYQPKIAIFIEQLFCVLLTPFILWFSLPECSDQIVDFFREFTVHVDGVGYLCSFAVFDFKTRDKGGKKGGATTDLRDDYYSARHDKLAMSYLGFMDNYQLNPKTGVPGHFPTGGRSQFQHPPSFPGLMSPTLGADMHASRMGRSERRPGNRAISSLPQAARTPRFQPAGERASPMPSMLLDPHHQPSATGFGGRSVRRESRSRYQPRKNIREEAIESGDESGPSNLTRQNSESKDPYESEGGLGESKWEMSPTRGMSKTADEDDDNGPVGGGGVLGMLYQFQKAQEGRGGINI